MTAGLGRQVNDYLSLFPDGLNLSPIRFSSDVDLGHSEKLASSRLQPGNNKISIMGESHRWSTLSDLCCQIFYE